MKPCIAVSGWLHWECHDDCCHSMERLDSLNWYSYYGTHKRSKGSPVGDYMVRVPKCQQCLRCGIQGAYDVLIRYLQYLKGPRCL